MAGDWDGNGTVTPGVVRAGHWFLRNANTGGVAESPSSLRRRVTCRSPRVGLRAGPRRQAAPGRAAGNDMTVLPTTANVVALTFDAGANANGVPKILSTLAAQGVEATFFLTGEFARDFPTRRATIGQRYPVGNHTDTHPHLPQLTDAQVQAQIQTTQTQIVNVARYDARPLFRFPFGDSDARTLNLVNASATRSISWTVDTARVAGHVGRPERVHCGQPRR